MSSWLLEPARGPTLPAVSDRPAGAAPAITFSADGGFDFAVRCLLTGVGYGMAEPGEMLATAEGIAPGDAEGWFRAWTELGARCDAIGARAAAAGHGHSAADAYLRAANYRFAGFYYVLATSDPGRHLSAWRAHRVSLRQAISHWDQPAQQLRVPWAGTEMVAWMVRAAAGTGSGDRPLMVIHNGLGLADLGHGDDRAARRRSPWVAHGRVRRSRPGPQPLHRRCGSRRRLGSGRRRGARRRPGGRWRRREPGRGRRDQRRRLPGGPPRRRRPPGHRPGV